MVSTSLKFIVFKNLSEILNVAVFVLFCLIITKPHYGLVPYLI